MSVFPKPCHMPLPHGYSRDNFDCFMEDCRQTVKKDSIPGLLASKDWPATAHLSVSDTAGHLVPFPAKNSPVWPVIYIIRPTRQSIITGLEALPMLPIMLKAHASKKRTP